MVIGSDHALQDNYESFQSDHLGSAFGRYPLCVDHHDYQNTAPTVIVEDELLVSPFLTSNNQNWEMPTKTLQAQIFFKININ